MNYLIKMLACAAIAAALTASPTFAQVIINDPRLPVAADQNFFCVANYCYYNPDGLTSKEISGGIFLVLLLYAWINRRNLAYWWRVEMEKMQPSSRPAKPIKKTSSARSGSPRKIEPLPDPLEDFSDTLSNSKQESKKRETWYVLRQGRSHGPYEKFQLRSFERITTESLVRRAGEKKWVKAGEIPDLVDFLE